MKLRLALLASIAWPIVCPLAAPAQGAPANSFVAGTTPLELEADPLTADAPDSKLYLDGTRAINESRWSDAIAIFSRVADQKSDHAAGALYWKAYAENKQGQASHALETCAGLRSQFSGSSWIDDCGALEIEIHASNGKPVAPGSEQSDDLKLLALNSLMQHDEARARAQIAGILEGDSSEQLKEGALFLLGRSVPDSTYPQIVRISALDGDVRVARASQNEKAKDATWEKAVVDLPLNDGDSIVTGDGRAEIELENASTIYLGPDSVLSCYDLHSTSGVPHSEIALLSGTLTLHLDSLMPGESVVLHTPTDNIVTRYPQAADLRIGSYVDGMAITPLSGGNLGLPGSGRQALSSGQTLYFHNAARVPQVAGDHAEDFTAFDKWVSDTHAARTAATHAVMQTAGLNVPIPGLAEMKDKGSFFDCAPYGTCWEPSSSADSVEMPSPEVLAAPQQNKPAATGSGIPPVLLSEADSGFPCLPSALRNWYLKDPVTGHVRYVGSGYDAGASSYEWAVCHSGSWIYHHRRYVWVVGHKRHHHDPVHWVKNGKTVAYVPIHPRDVKGQLPFNREHGLIATREKDGFTLRPTAFEPAHPVELMKSPPREFRPERLPVLARAESPRMEAHALKPAVANNSAMPRTTAIPLSFDHRSQSFLMPHQVAQGNHSTTVFTPVANQGGAVSRSGNSGSGGGFHGGGSNGTASSGSHGNSTTSSGGSHGGGTTSSSSAAPASSISVSSSSSSSSAHH